MTTSGAAADRSTAGSSTAPTAPRARSHSALALVAFIAIVAAVAAFGSITSASAIDGWYAETPKPMWNPPNAVFGPVWTVLYLAMAIAAWLIWKAPASLERTRALKAYVVQLVLNAIWTPAFFGLGSLIGAPGVWFALGLIVVLNFAILAAIIRFGDVSKLAAALLIPYWFWTLFATTLNAAIAVLAR
ncbi:MAG: tryptophan-rich sensory protein [Microcella sp.]|uniref:TspO/MBR family protein n=1 Tax=Microcella sp. TaxID=1913979 RepID=UPI0024C874E7|nr:TspO/MBR family protein [Microcella sp.]UYN83961.1 MAG: tryptophan-rich sensory protein [Microcella sp.]